MNKEIRIPAAYRCLKKEWVPEVNSDTLQLEHIKSGARVLLFSNDDAHKVFSIAFRTPPSDDTGVPHILEHCVLGGSRKYPLKDPMIALYKSSLQTFLNAFTYPDKTIYPVASCNDKDFANLMDVYLDAVFHPLLHEIESIFLQEGWRYDIGAEDEPLTINGVVYNEMKGALSSPEDVLRRRQQLSLFPDTAYGYESGGDPVHIPKLTYEQFCDFHKTYYHPSNSYIFLYGDMDMEERLAYLDEAYLSDYERREIDSALSLQAAPAAMTTHTDEYALAPGEDTKDRAYLSVQWVTGLMTDAVTVRAMEILDSVLLSSPGAPIKQALLDAGIGADIDGGYSGSGLQCVFSVTACDAAEEQKDDFLRIVREVLERQAQEGPDEKSLLACLNSFEFRAREADFGGYPKGLVYMLDAMDGWLFDADPLLHLKFEESFRFLRGMIGTDYYRQLIRKYLLDNPHMSMIVLKPVAGLTEQQDERLSRELEEKKRAMSAEELRGLIEKRRLLEEYQNAPDTPQALAAIPRLSLSDIERKTRPLNNHVMPGGVCRCVHHDIFTSGIGYVNLYFGLQSVAQEEIPWLGLLGTMLGAVSTEKYTYRELYDEMRTYAGSFGTAISALPRYGGNPEDFTPYVNVHVRALHENMERVVSLLEEILLRSRFDDEKRLRELLLQTKVSLRRGLADEGHLTAIARACSYVFGSSCFTEQTSGLSFCRFVEELEENFSERKEEIASRLASLTKKIFARGDVTMSITCEGARADELRGRFDVLWEHLPQSAPAVFVTPKPVVKNEGLKTSGSVQFVARAGSYEKAGPYTGALRILKSVLSDEYLWQNIRVKGGAYGCMCGFSSDGRGYLCSYRDPHLKRTLEVYDAIPEYIRTLKLSRAELDDYIIAAIGTMDRPLSPSATGASDMRCLLSGITQEQLQRERDEVMDCTPEDVCRLADYVQCILDSGLVCAVGSSAKIEEDRDVFLTIENLMGGDAS